MTAGEDAHGGDSGSGADPGRGGGPGHGPRGAVPASLAGDPITAAGGEGAGTRPESAGAAGRSPSRSVTGHGTEAVTGSAAASDTRTATGPRAQSVTGRIAEPVTGPALRPTRGQWAEVPLRVTEFTDAACPWAWGAEPAFRLLRQTLGASASWRRVFGILFDEDDDPAPDPDAEARWYDGFIREVAAHTGAPRARRLHWLARTSWPASRAVRAAAAQGEEVASRVLRRLRETTFVLGAPADTPEGVREAVRGVPGLDVARLVREMAGPAADAAVRADHAEARRPHPQVWGLTEPGPHPGGAKELADGRRYALPTLLFEGPGGTVCVPGHRPLGAYLAAAGAAARVPVPDPVRLPSAVALERWRTLTGPELAVLTSGGQPSPDAVRLATGNGPLWLHPDEARTHPATRKRSAAGESAGHAGLSQ
ncbi:DsbA family oxidoreductase [Streptomyces axinellae]|uniref:DSBA-like thioredoxin domain-containing protein n=1 Tax=Streptomyces axinellae TaxID=552788 RepID=A0ABP6CHW8_9ACTN